MMLSLYRGLLRVGEPLLLRHLKKRQDIGKEPLDRFGERLGQTTLARPDGHLIWMHGASVGESVTMLPLIKTLLHRNPKLHILVTTGTVTSAAVMEARLPERAFHQFVPVDHPSWAKSFLDHWRPEAVLWFESELWPNLLLEVSARQIPAMLLNARMSEKSLKNWMRFSGSARKVLEAFETILAESPESENRFKSLRRDGVRNVGNLKDFAEPLPVDSLAVKELLEDMQGRPAWVAASTHEGEEEIIARAHKEIKKQIPDILTIVIPRHPNRSGDVQQAIGAEGVFVSRRQRDHDITEATDVYLAATMGELGIFFDLVEVAFVGGSLVEGVGGHNPLEPMRLDCAVLYGPYTENFAATIRMMEASGAGHCVASEKELAETVVELLQNDQLRKSHMAIGKSVASEGRAVMEAVMLAIESVVPFLQKDAL